MSDGAIAIVGASCRFPGATSLEAFWRLLRNGVDAVSEVGSDRWSTRYFYHPVRGELGKTYSWAAGLLDGIDQFEPGFFGIAPREAAQMDPQQRLLLELAWHALEDAGIPASRLAGSAAGVYIGASSTDYGDLRLGDPASGDAYFITGSALSILANRISHVFDLRGPSLVVDTACSSSLVALHHACEALRGDRIDAALVGGINLLLSPYPFLGFAHAAMLSRRGRCYAFDARADGYVRGEGGGIVVLKRLERALADRDPIRAVIRGTAVSSSGRTIGLSLPSEAAQAGLLRAVYREAGIPPDALAFFEMHGTGTPAGDPAEAAAVGQVLGQARGEKLPIGSVKTNIGHLEPASGMAGLLKAALALERGVLPASLHGETANPNIPFDRLNLRLVGAAEIIPPGRQWYAGINSFGFGGTNAHAILAAPPPRAPEAADRALPPLMVSARSEASLRILAEKWRDTLAAAPAERAPPLLRAAARRRDHHPHRLVVLGDDLATGLGNFIAGRASPAVVSGTALREGRLAFVYSGNGAQFLGMGQAAYRASAAFRDAVEVADRVLTPRLGWSVGERVASGVADKEIRRADIAQPMLFAIQVAITRVLREFGIAASGFVGHSVGEIAAAWAAGALSLDSAAQIVAARSRHQQQTQGSGRMAVLALGAGEAQALLADLSSSLEIAAINSARSVTVAGDAEAIAELGSEAARRGIAWRALDLDFAFHSTAMEPMREALLAELAGIVSAAPTGDLISTVTARCVGAGALDATHWWRNIRDPVRFAEAIARLIADRYRIFVEIGPNPVLLPYLREALRPEDAAGRVVATLDRRHEAGDPFPAIAAQLHVAGCDLSGATWLDGPDNPRGLPLYPWQRERFWFSRTVEAAEQVNPVCDHMLLGFREAGALPSWRNHLDTALFPFLADHRIDGVPVLPAAAIIDMALAAARSRHPDAAALELRDVELLRPVAFADAETREVRCALVSPDGDWQLSSRQRLADEPMTLHATAQLTSALPDRLLPAAEGAAPRRVVTGQALYRHAARLGLDYGESFRTVSDVVITGDGRATVALAMPLADAGFDSLILPALLDGALQGLLALLFDRDDDLSEAGYLPRRFAKVRAFAPFGRVPRRAELRLTRRGARSAAADIALYDAAGALIAELADCGFAKFELNRTSAPTECYLRVERVPAPLDPPKPPCVLGRLAEILRRLAASQHPDAAKEAGQALLLDALIASVCLEAISGLLDGEPAFSVRALLESGEVASQAAPLLARLLTLLERFGAVAADDGAWQIEPDNDLPDVGELWRSLLAETPDMVAELALVAMLREELPRMLRGGNRPFDAASPMVEALRHAAPPVAAGRAIIAAALDAITAQWPPGRPLRICELGIGRLGDRLRRSALPVIRVGEGEPCDVAMSIDTGPLDLSAYAGLVPGGALLAVAAVANPLWDLLFDNRADRRAELAEAGFVDIGSAPAAHGPWPCEVVWARMPAEPAANTATSASLSLGVIADGADTGFAAALEAAGHRLAPEDIASDAIILAAGAEGDPVAEASRQLPLLARLATAAAGRQIPLWLVTRGAQQPGDDAGLIGAALWGFGRVLRNETQGLTLRLVDLPATMPATDTAQCIVRELAAAGAETEIVWTPAGRHVLRLRRGLPPAWAEPDEMIVAASERPGRLDRLGWASAPAHPPGAGEIEIEVHAAGVNFRDVMWATGMLPEEALVDRFAGAALGLECAGVVRAVGEGSEGVAVGDRVAGFAPSAMASRVVTRANAVIGIPPEIGFAAAATLPVAFVTASYSLRTLARLMPGECVLIHASAGGVGLAAIQIAKGRGATVIATAGSPAKRAFLRLLGADHVCDSRELRFVAEVRRATGGVGVDVVLNSLHGEAMEASLELLKPFGRFIELGKRDFYENRRVRARLLRQNISYFAVDIDQLPVQRPELAKALLAELSAALAAGEIRPLAHRCFAFAEIADAFRLMQAAQHIGKLILVPQGNVGVAVSRPPDLKLRNDGCYVVTGGIGGFGFAAARWFAGQGARRLALIGRRGAETPGAAERIAELEALGATVGVYAADVADSDALARTLAAIRGEGVPIRGVIHAAAAIVDGMAGAIAPADVNAALRAKLGGAVLLDRLTGDDPLDLFWLFSSATTLIGAPGQGAYVAANLGFEALARRRHAAGRSALAIAWGPIADAGILAERPDERETLARRLGSRPIAAAAALAALPAMAASGLPVVAFADTRWSEARQVLPAMAAPFFEEFRAEAAGPATDEALLDRLAGLDDSGRRELLETIVGDEAARILRLSAIDLEAKRPLAELGMDSLMAIELRLAIEARLRVELPLVTLAEGTSVASLAARLAERLSRPVQAETVAELAARHETPLDPFALGGIDLAAEE